MRVRIKGKKLANNGLQVEGNQYDMLSGSMMEIKGKPHSQGGTDLAYNGTVVEAEAGEPLMIDEDGSAVIFGNLNVPGSKKKFKTVAKGLAKEENKATRMQDKATKYINTSNPFNPYSSLTFNTGTVLQDAAQQKSVDIHNRKEELADIQQFMLDISEQTGKSPEKISSIFQNGGKLKPKYKDGGAIARDGYSIPELKKQFGKYESTNNYTAMPPVDPDTGKRASSAYGKYQFIEGTRKDYYNKYFKDQYPTFEVFDLAFKNSPELQEEVMDVHLQKLSDEFAGDPTFIILAHRLGEEAAKSLQEKGYYMDGKRKVTLDDPIGTSSAATSKETGRDYLKKYGLGTAESYDPTKGKAGDSKYAPHPNFNPDLVEISTREQQSPFMLDTRGIQQIPTSREFTPQMATQESLDSAVAYSKNNTPTPKKPMGSAADLNKLGLRDFLSEIPAIFDRADYVEGQKYEPILYQPFQVSFQDRLNQNNSTFRNISQQVPNNPAALSVLAGQKYGADSQVLGEQFRTNQQIANEVTTKNTTLLNDATLKNLQLQDLQYDRQQKAQAVTDDRRYQALASISNKFGQNRKDNSTIRLTENLFDYRPDAKLNMNYVGDKAAFNFGNSARNSMIENFDPEQQKIYKEELAKQAAKAYIDAAQKTTKKWGGFLPKTK